VILARDFPQDVHLLADQLIARPLADAESVEFFLEGSESEA